MHAPGSRSSLSWLCAILLLTASSGCKGDPPPDTADTGGDDAPADLPAGSTAIVVVLNPVVNDGHQAGVPSVLAETRDDVHVDAEPGGDGITDITGLTVVEAEPGPTVLRLGPEDDDDRAQLDVSVVADGDVYDAPIAWDGVMAEAFDGTPIRYPVGDGSGAIFLDPDTPLSQLEDELAEDDAVVVLRPGVYVGDITIRGRGVLLFGEGFSEAAVTIDGSIQANGEAVRLRGLSVVGGVTAAGNNFGMSFMVVHGPASITGNGGAFLRNVFCGDVTVPSSSATLLDNYGLAPLDEPPAERCEPTDGGADSTTG